MDGKFVVNLVETALVQKGIPKGEFYEKCGISSATFSQWRSGQYEPSAANLKKIQDFLGIRFIEGGRDATVEKTPYEKETDELLESIRSRSDLRVLLRSACGLPPSSVYELVAQAEKEKERNTQ